MSYLVCHVMKMTAKDLRGVSIHNNRESSHSSNKDIDYSRTAQNFDALTRESGNPHTNYRVEVEKRLQANYKGAKAVRKDAVRLVSVVVSSDRQFFEGKSREDTERFFNTAAEFLAERYGRENVVAAKVHMDETTPHMHFTFVPLTTDGRLSAKEIITRSELRSLQDDLPKTLQERGYDIERGIENSPSEHIPITQLKRDTRQIIDFASSQEAAVKQAHQRAKTERAGIFDGTKVVKIPLDDYKTIYNAAQNTRKIANEAILLQLRDAREVLPPLNKKVKEQEQQIDELQEKMQEQQKVVDEQKKRLKELEQRNKVLERKEQWYKEIKQEIPQVKEMYAEKVDQYNTQLMKNWQPQNSRKLTPEDICKMEIKRQIVEEGRTFSAVDKSRVGEAVYARTRSISETEKIMKKVYNNKNLKFVLPQKKRTERKHERGGMEM